MTTEMMLYQSKDLQVKLDVLVENETVWLSQKQMATLYGTAVPAISKHIKNIFESGELHTNSTVSKMEIVQQEGERTVCQTTTMYNMDMIIAVGYRVNSIQATNFRIWATQVIKEYLYRGYAIYQLDVNRQNMQYPPVQLRVLSSVHDRFLLLDDRVLYTFGASFKDLGRKLFCFTQIESADMVEVVRRLSS